MHTGIRQEEKGNMEYSQRFKSGIFLPPHHPIEENTTLAIQRDLELIDFLDTIGYDEAWVGEHHSGGYEIIGSPEIFIAAAAERTRRIMLGTGVVSLPYHHPFLVADRMLQLDHQTKGRVLFGVGPGLLASDSKMLGLSADKARERMEEAVEVILKLFAGETVTKKSDWFTLQDGKLQLQPYTRPWPHIAVASARTPSGAVLAGRLGLGILCVAASSGAGYDVLDVNWGIAQKHAAENGHEMSRENFRIVAPFHIAEDRDKARANVKWGFDKWQQYALAVNPNGGFFGMGGLDDAVKNGRAVVGTPDDAVEFLDRYWNKTGGFGCMLQMAHNWAPFEETKKSYELYLRYVVPKFEARNRARQESFDWINNNSAEFSGTREAASQKAISKYRDNMPGTRK